MNAHTRYHRRGFAILAASVVVLLWSSIARLEEPAAATFAKWDHTKLVKESTCKLCHGKDPIGNQYKVWQNGPHAKAFLALKTDKAKEVGAAHGVADPSTSPSCLQCHSTAYGFSQQVVTTLITVEEGVTCQTCHGPADDYKNKARHATNPAESIAKYGLIVPTQANTCSHCHNERNPTYNPERYTRPDGTKVDFDFEQASAKIRHALKK